MNNVNALGKWNLAIITAEIALGKFVLANNSAILSSKELTVVTQIGGFKNLISDIGNAIQMLLGLKGAEEGATISATALNIADSALLLGIPLIAEAVGFLISKYQKEKQTIDDLKQAYIDYSNAVKSNDTSGISASVDAIQKSQDKLNELYKKMQNASNNPGDMGYSFQKAQEDYDNYVSALEKGGFKVDETTHKIIQLKSAQDALTRNQNLDTAVREIQENTNLADNSIAKLITSYKQLSEQQNKGDLEKQQQAKIVDQLKQKFGDLTVSTDASGNSFIVNTDVLLKHAEALSADTQTMDSNITASYNQVQVQQDLSAQFDTAAEKVKDLSTFMTDLNKNHELSASDIEKVMKSYNMLIPYLGNEKSLRQAIQQEMTNEANTQQKLYTAMIENSTEFYKDNVLNNKKFVDSTNDMLNTMLKNDAKYTGNLSENYNIDLKNYKSLSDAKLAVDNKLRSILAQGWGEYVQIVNNAANVNYQKIFDQMGTSFGASGVMNGATLNAIKQAQGVANIYNNQMKQVTASFDAYAAKYSNGVNFKGIDESGIKPGGSSGSTKSTPTHQTTDATDFDQYKTQIESITQSLDKQDKVISKLQSDEKKYASLKDVANQMKAESQIIEEQNNKLKLLNKSKTDVTAIQEKIKSQMMKDTNFASWIKKNNLNLDTLTQAQLEQIWNHFYGVARDFGTGKVAENMKKNFESAGKNLKTLIGDWQSAGDELQNINTGIDNITVDIKTTTEEIQKYVNTQLESSLEKVVFGGMTESEYESAQKKVIDGIQDQIDALNEKGEVEDEEADRQQKLLDIANKQQNVNDIVNNKDVRIYENGQWTWQSDPHKLKDAQDALKSAQDDYNKWEIDTQRKHDIEKLQQQKDTAQKTLDNLKQAFSDMKEQIENGNTDITTLLGNNIDNLKSIFTGDKWDKFMSSLKSAVSDAQAEYAKLADIQTPEKPTTPTTPTQDTTTPKTTPTITDYKVQKGDTLESIAKKFGVTTQEIMNVSSNIPKSGIHKGWVYAGSVIKIPKYENGTDFAEEGLSLVGEHGAELKVLNRGDGILNSEFTKRLISLGQNYSAIMNNIINPINIPKYAFAGAGIKGNGGIVNNYNIDVGEVRTNDASQFVTNLKNLAYKK